MHGYLTNAARVKNPAALQRSKLDTPLLAAGFLIVLQKLHSRLQKSTWVLHSKDFLCILFTEITVQRIKVKLWNSYTKDIKGGKEVGEGKLP